MDPETSKRRLVDCACCRDGRGAVLRLAALAWRLAYRADYPPTTAPPGEQDVGFQCHVVVSILGPGIRGNKRQVNEDSNAGDVGT